MANSLIVFNQVIIMFLISFCGYLLIKLKLVNVDCCKSLTNILLYIVTPSVIVVALVREYNPNEARGFFAALALSLFLQITFILIATLIIPRKGNNNAGLQRFAAVMPNTGYIGIPMAQAVLGLDGVFFIAANIIVFNLLLFSYGRLQLEADSAVTQGKPLPKFRFDKKIIPCFINPATISAALGLTLYLSNTTLPNTILAVARHFYGLNTALPMLIVGIILAESDLKSILTDFSCNFISFLRLLLLPVIGVILLALIDISWFTENSQLIKSALIIGLCTPSAVASTFASLAYGADSAYASRMVANSTVFSIITMPLIFLLWEIIPKL